MTGQDRTVKKVTKPLYFTYLGRSLHWTRTDFHRNLHSSWRPWRKGSSAYYMTLKCQFLKLSLPHITLYNSFADPLNYITLVYPPPLVNLHVQYSRSINDAINFITRRTEKQNHSKRKRQTKRTRSSVLTVPPVCWRCPLNKMHTSD